MNITELLRLSNRFYKRANLETDMAKRIMFSIIPSVMTPTEKQSTPVDPQYWGVDYKALRSAASGAKDLVKYGTLACVQELAYYHSPSENTYYRAKHMADKGNLLDALKLCERCFLDLKKWDQGYGREAWARIAQTLFQLEEKRSFLELTREESRERRDPKTDYTSLEVETMKEIIVLMNVFDGLAHNSGSIMPKLIHEEQEVAGSAGHEYDAKMNDRVSRMMDAKELTNPIDVYKSVENIMERPEYRSSFGDWITRLRNSPDFNTPTDWETNELELGKVKAKKFFQQYLPPIEGRINNIVAVKDRLMTTHDKIGKIELYKSLYKIIYDLKGDLISFSSALPHHIERAPEKSEFRNNLEALRKWCGGAIEVLRNVSNAIINAYPASINDYRSRAVDLEKWNNSKYDDDNAMSDTRKIRRMITQLEGMIASL